MPSTLSDTPVGGPRRPPRRTGRAFTLVELLVVVTIIAMLLGMVMPTLVRAQQLTRQTICLHNVGIQMRAIAMYAAGQDGAIPAGPTGLDQMATNQIWIGEPQPPPATDSPHAHYNGHGALLETELMPEALFCPDDDSADPEEELAKIRGRVKEDVYCSYLYRQLDAQAADPPSRRLHSLGLNHDGEPIRALVMDMNSLMVFPPQYNVPIRTNHGGVVVSVGFAAGHAAQFEDPDGHLTLHNGDQARLYGPPPTRLDEIFQYADTLRQ